MFANGTIAGAGYDFDINFFNESEIDPMTDNPCDSPFGHILICVNRVSDDSSARIDNGIIVTDKWILTSATTCLNIYNNPWNDYFIQAGKTNLTEFTGGSAIKDYHIYANENENPYRGCNQHNDYCLIELETPLVIGEAIQAIGFQSLSGLTTTTSEWTTTWDSTWHPGLTTTLTTTTTTTTTTATTTTTTSTTIDGRKKRQVMPPLPTFTTTWTWPTTTTTTTTETFPNYSLDRCWIAAWSDENLRTFKADVDSECYDYYFYDHISFRRNKLSTKERAKLRKKIENYKTQNDKKQESYHHDMPVVETEDDQLHDAMGTMNEINYRRSHFCIENLRKVSMC